MECEICDVLNSEPKSVGMINECLSMLSNETSAKLLSKYYNLDLTAQKIYQHKQHATDWIPLREKIAEIKWETVSDYAQYFLLDGLHRALLRPAQTSAYASLQALKTILDAQIAEQNSDVSSTYNVIEEVKSVVLDETADQPELRAKIASRLDGVIYKCLEARI